MKRIKSKFSWGEPFYDFVPGRVCLANQELASSCQSKRESHLLLRNVAQERRLCWCQDAWFSTLPTKSHFAQAGARAPRSTESYLDLQGVGFSRQNTLELLVKPSWYLRLKLPPAIVVSPCVFIAKPPAVLVNSWATECYWPLQMSMTTSWHSLLHVNNPLLEPNSFIPGWKQVDLKS